MNNVVVSGYVQDEPKVYNGQVKVVAFTLSIGRGKNKNGESLGYDFPKVKVFGSTAEYVAQKLKKGDYATVLGRIATDSYEGKNGKVYTTEVQAQRVEIASSFVKEESSSQGGYIDLWND